MSYILGALESDYPVDEDILKADAYPQFPDGPAPPPGQGEEKKEGEEPGIGGISFVQCATGSSVGAGDLTPPMQEQPGSRGEIFHVFFFC